jgi:predicted NBD/HSP70 family sugar kinase/1-acyl-sn-glycerol-3-phosphate acyltransferase
VHAIGIDIGGTKIAGAVVDEFGAIVRSERVPTPRATAAPRGCGRRHDRVALRRRHVGRRGVAPPGSSTPRSRPSTTRPTSTGATSRSARARGPRRHDVVVDNDANAAGWAEFRFGAGRLVSDMVMLTIGTGVGGAIVAGDGCSAAASAPGASSATSASSRRHRLRLRPARMPRAVRLGPRAAPHGERDRRRRRDRQALAEAAREHGELDGTLVGALIEQDDRGVAALRQLGHWLGRPRASLSARARPAALRVRRRRGRRGELLLGPIREAYLAAPAGARLPPRADFVIAELVNDAGVVGAADLARLVDTPDARSALAEAFVGPREVALFYWFMKNIVVGPILLAIFRPWVVGLRTSQATARSSSRRNHLSFIDSIFLPLVVDRRSSSSRRASTSPARASRAGRRARSSRQRAAAHRPLGRQGSEASLTPASGCSATAASSASTRGHPQPRRALYRGRTGVARMVLEAGVPVIPVAMIGTEKVMPIGTQLPKVRRIGIIIGEPLDFSRFEGLEGDRFVLRSVTDELVYELRAQRPGVRRRVRAVVQEQRAQSR